MSSGGLESVEDGHADVHQDHVREGAPGEVDGLAAGGRGAGDQHVVLGVDQCCEAVADRGLVVGDEYADHRLGWYGSSACTPKPIAARTGVERAADRFGALAHSGDADPRLSCRCRCDDAPAPFSISSDEAGGVEARG